MTRFKRLLEPLQIKQVRFRNRMVKSGQRLGYADQNGDVGQRNLDFYETIAKGGVGMIVAEHAYVDFPLGGRDFQLSAAEDKFIPSLAELAKIVHKHGCPIFQQISHVGPEHNPKSSGLQAVAASTLSEDYMHKIFPGHAYHPTRPLTIPEIEDIVGKFADAAERVQRAGFDGIEIHAAHSYLINCFLSRVWNKREDEYGGQSLETRARFAIEILRAMRERVGPDFPIGFRINGAEYGHEDGTTSEESQEIAKMLEAAGVDCIHVTGYGYGAYYRFFLPEQIFYPEPPKPLAKELYKRSISEGLIVPLAAAIKKVVSVPVIAVGRLDPVCGERILRKGMADAIAIGRRLLADPELPNKIAEGRLGDIVPCTGCYTCSDLNAKGKHVTCRANAALGREREYEIRPAEKEKRVVVVGGGPSGMEAARVAALRGHEVILYEKEPKLGGLLPLAALIKGLEIEDIPALNKYLKTQIIKLGVKIRLGKEFTPALNEEIKPDVVILATGGVPVTPEIPGINRRNVVTSEQLHCKVRRFLRFLGPRVMGRLTKFWLPIGNRVVIIGGLTCGCLTAEFLVKRGRKVTIVEASDQLGDGMVQLHKIKLLNWLAKKGATVFTGVKYEEITDKGLIITTKEGQKQTIEADTILTAIPPKPNTELLQALEGKVPEVYLSGDSKEPRLIVDAIADGSQIGRAI